MLKEVSHACDYNQILIGREVRCKKELFIHASPHSDGDTINDFDIMQDSLVATLAIATNKGRSVANMLTAIDAVGLTERETMLERQRVRITKTQREGRYRDVRRSPRGNATFHHKKPARM